MPTDYWLSKLFYDLQGTAAVSEYRAHPQTVLDRYPLAPEVRHALETDDVAVLAPRVNAYLLRYYFTARGLSDADFIARVRTTAGRG